MRSGTFALRALLASTLLLPVSCSSFRAYSGPDRSRDEVARIGEMTALGGMLIGDNSTTSVVEVDGLSVADHPGNSVDVLPGRHVLRVTGSMGMPGMRPEQLAGTITFDAAPGGAYELVMTIGGSQPAYLVLEDADTYAHVADAKPTIEQLRTADVALDSSWVMTTWSRSGDSVLLVMGPAGQSLAMSPELIGLYARQTADASAAALDREVDSIRADSAGHRPPYTVTLISSGPSMRMLESRGRQREGDPEEFGLTCIRGAAGRIHRLSYTARSEAIYRDARSKYLQVFANASLTWPGP
jgi:hypothetical protein